MPKCDRYFLLLQYRFAPKASKKLVSNSVSKNIRDSERFEG